MTNLNFSMYKEGRIVKIRIVRKRYFFKTFAVVQIRREQLSCSAIPRPNSNAEWRVVGMFDWKDVDPNNLYEIHEAITFMETFNEQKQTKQP